MNLLGLYRSLPDSLQPIAKRMFKCQRWFRYYLRLPYQRFLDKHRLNDLDNIYSEEYFRKRMNPPHDTTAEAIVTELTSRYQPQSVADIGCAIGHYLSKFKNKGISVFGVEGSKKAVNNAIINEVRQGDLRDGIFLTTNFDLVTCFEVSEHLHPNYADRIVDTVVSATHDESIIVFTAAQPEQYGTHHLNLQPRSYWIKKFELRGCSYDVEETANLVTSLKNEIKVAPWPLENIMVFRRHSEER